mgnify:CR=1 FL=1
MKVEVKSSFIDKTDHVTELRVGQVIDIGDAERVADLVERGLVKKLEEEKPKPKTKATKK